MISGHCLDMSDVQLMEFADNLNMRGGKKEFSDFRVSGQAAER